MKKDEIRAVEMTRRIRDSHYRLLKGKTSEECIRFYEQKAEQLRKSIDWKSQAQASQSKSPS